MSDTQSERRSFVAASGLISPRIAASDKHNRLIQVKKRANQTIQSTKQKPRALQIGNPDDLEMVSIFSGNIRR